MAESRRVDCTAEFDPDATYHEDTAPTSGRIRRCPCGKYAYLPWRERTTGRPVLQLVLRLDKYGAPLG